jgi:ABC-type sugar transport system permease subunit
MAVQPYSQTIEGMGTAHSGRLRVRRHVLQRYIVAYLFILPVLLLYLVFVLRPTLQTFWLAFYEWNGISIDREWVGFANFQRLFGDPIFWQALQHSLIWTAVVVTFNLVVGLIAAALLAGSIRGRLLFQLGYFLPVVQASIVTAMIWLWIYAPTGVLNTGL